MRTSPRNIISPVSASICHLEKQSITTAAHSIRQNSSADMCDAQHVYFGRAPSDSLYYATFFFDESVYAAVYCRPEPFYFWAYFVMLNGFWVVIPGWLIIQSTIESTKAFRFAQETTRQGSPK
ncbi:hypothetical protein EDB81DRAFT_670625 [Dactylonectria macrodidyma]|uniref:EXPERA domain-containing protein n=1 Tax=Dactylonectria macrodidyma TaxID=307937 RepID=A0A9P9IAC9_9HYPO|nr:hypothetical protein EDB81DRAFT_670625 [Dactylonectria macrodidyma]